MSQTRASQRGVSKLKLLIILVMTYFVVIGLVRIVPVFVNKFEFEDAVRQEAKFASVRQAEPQEIRQRLFQKAQQLGIPMRPEQIVVRPAAGGGVRISVRYSVPVQLPGYVWTRNFSISADTASAY